MYIYCFKKLKRKNIVKEKKISHDHRIHRLTTSIVLVFLLPAFFSKTSSRWIHKLVGK